MKLTIQRETLLKPLQQVTGVVERRQTLPILGNVLLSAGKKNLKLTATDLEVELQAQATVGVEEPGDITLPARKLLDIFRTLPEEAEISITVKNDKAQVQSGKSRFTLATMPASEFPVVEKIKSARKFSLAQTDMHRLIDHTAFSMAQQDVRYYLNGLMLEPAGGVLRAVATDGHRLAMCELAADVGESSEQQVIVPRKGVQELQIDGRFPDYQRVIPEGADKILGVNRELLRQALTRTSILSNEKYRGIRLDISKNILKIQAHNPEQEEAVEELEVDYNDDSMLIGFNVTYLLDVLGAIDGANVDLHLSDANSSALITKPGDDECRYVVMPMRL
jgi:DNA polymerase-3 subunit beta